MPRPRADRYRDIRARIELLGHSNVPELRRNVYVALVPPDSITRDAAELLGFLVSGYDDPQIAAIRHRSVQTIRNRISELNRLLGARGREHLAFEALRRRIVIIIAED